MDRSTEVFLAFAGFEIFFSILQEDNFSWFVDVPALNFCPESEGVSGKWRHCIEGIPDRLPKMSPSISKKRSWFWLPKVFKVSFWVVNQIEYHWRQMDDDVWLYDIQSYSVCLHQLHHLFKFLSYSTTITMKLSSTADVWAYMEECKGSITHTLPLSDIVLCAMCFSGLCGPSKATLQCYTSMCDGIIECFGFLVCHSWLSLSDVLYHWVPSTTNKNSYKLKTRFSFYDAPWFVAHSTQSHFCCRKTSFQNSMVEQLGMGRVISVRWNFRSMNNI